ncbi:hypothetical protein D3C75_271780 [compost metagenome]
MVINVCFNIFQHPAAVTGKRSADFTGIGIQKLIEQAFKLAERCVIPAKAQRSQPSVLDRTQRSRRFIQLTGKIAEQHQKFAERTLCIPQAEAGGGLPFPGELTQNAFGMGRIAVLQNTADLRHPSG